MAEAVATRASPGRQDRGLFSARIAHPGRGGRAKSGVLLTTSERRRAGNRTLRGLVSDLRCECARPSCREFVPAAAETQRGNSDRFVVTPAHFAGGVVVRAADRYFVVEPGRDGQT